METGSHISIVLWIYKDNSGGTTTGTGQGVINPACHLEFKEDI